MTNRRSHFAVRSALCLALGMTALLAVDAQVARASGRPKTPRSAAGPRRAPPTRIERVERPVHEAKPIRRKGATKAFLHELGRAFEQAAAGGSRELTPDMYDRLVSQAERASGAGPRTLRVAAGRELFDARALPPALRDPRHMQELRAAVTRVTGLPPIVSARAAPAAFAEATRFFQRDAKNPPAHRGVRIPKVAYVPLRALQLKRPRLLWVNRKLMASLGIPVPEGRLAPEFEKEFLRLFAIAVPPRDNTRDFVKGTEREVAADLYGGEAVWGTRGSGRAITVSENFQIKGGGDTGLSQQNIGKLMGAISPTDAIYEVIYGEVNAAELPHGKDSGRYLGVISYGSQRDPKVLAIRMDAVRPAHFMWSELDRTFDPQGERTKQAAALIENALPAPAGERARISRAQRVKGRLEQYARRLADQYATGYVKRLYHGGTSASNAQTNGGWLDYALQTAQPNYGAINTSYPEASSNEFHVIRKMLVEDFVTDVARRVEGIKPDEARRLGELFDRTMERTVRSRFVEMAGFPTPVIDRLAKSAEFNRLGRTIAEIASKPLDGNPRSIHVGPPHGSTAKTGGFMPERTSEYDVNRILQKLARVPARSPERLEAAIAKDLPARELRRELVEGYRAFYQRAAEEARADGVEAKAFAKLIRGRAAVLNEPMDLLYRPKLQDAIEDRIKQFKRSGDSAGIHELIESTVTESRRTHETGDYEVVLATRVNKKNGTVSQRVYDATRDRTFTR